MLLAEFHHKAAEYSLGAWMIAGLFLAVILLGAFLLGRLALNYLKSNTNRGS